MATTKRTKTTKEKSAQETRVLVEDSLKRYLTDIRKYPILTKPEEFRLARCYTEDNDSTAAMQLITSNLRLVVKIALEYQSTTISLLDLIQEGNVGLMQAVKKFDPERNIRLSSYAQWWIRAYILKYLMDNYKLVKLGTTQAQRKLFYNLKKEREKLAQQGITPTAKLLAERLAVRERDVREMETRLSGREVSLDSPLNDGESGTLLDFVASQDPFADEIVGQREASVLLMDKLAAFRKTLKGRDVEIWERRLLSHDPMTLQQLGDLFGVSRERARQLEARIVSNLGKFLHKEIEDVDGLHLEFPLFH